MVIIKEIIVFFRGDSQFLEKIHCRISMKIQDSWDSLNNFKIGAQSEYLENLKGDFEDSTMCFR